MTSMNPLAGRITFTCDGGPLNGRIVYHSMLPKDPSKSVLYRMVTKAGRGEVLKQEGGDVEALGMYHLEDRKGTWVAVHDVSEQDKEWGPLEVPVVEEAKEQEAKPKREKRTITIPDDHPMALRMKPYLASIRAALDRKKEDERRSQD